MRWKRTFLPAGAVVALFPIASWATPVDLDSGVEIYGGGYSAWAVASDVVDSCTSSPGSTALAIVDGQFQSPAITDAFDGGHVVVVDGMPIDASTGTLTGSSVTAPCTDRGRSG